MYSPRRLVQTSIATGLLLPALALAQLAPPPPPARLEPGLLAPRPTPSVPRTDVADRTSLALRGERELSFDRDEQGALWVRGHDYKASFDAHGAMYVPFFGSSAPRNFPVQLRLAEVVVAGEPIELLNAAGAQRDGAVVTIDHGLVDEVYHIALNSIEQTIVLAQRPAQGELIVRIAVETELTPSELEDRIEFANDLGAVRYGRASIVGRDGSLTGLATNFVDGGIEIRVPSEVMAAAEFPLVIDPVISTFTIDTVTLDNQYPNVAYDVTTDRYLVAYLEIFSATDFDVYSNLRDGNGAFAGGGYVDSTTEDWYLPAVANLNRTDSFLVVSTTGDIASTTNRRIRGRITGAATVSYGPAIDISGAATLSNFYPEVGGDSYAGPGSSYFCVGWQRTLGGLDQVVYRLVDSAGVPQGADATVLQSGGGTKDVSISKDNNTVRWNIAWDRCPSSASDCDVFAARVHWDGFIDSAAFPVSDVSLANYAPHVSASNSADRFVIAWNIDNGLTDKNVAVALITTATVSSRADLTALESADVLEQQFVTSIALANEQFYVGYNESFNGSGTDYDPYVASVIPVGASIALAERHEDLSFTSAREDQVALCAEESGGAFTNRIFAAWRNLPSAATQSDISGNLIDTAVGGAQVPFCSGDGTGTACPCAPGSAGRGCGNSVHAIGALLSSGGTASVGADTLVFMASLTAGGPGLFFQGSNVASIATGIGFGDGLLCVGGSLVRMAVKFPVGGQLIFPSAGDPAVHVAGSVLTTPGVRYYQTWYRDAAPFCSASTFNLTNGVRVTWLP